MKGRLSLQGPPALGCCCRAGAAAVQCRNQCSLCCGWASGPVRRPARSSAVRARDPSLHVLNSLQLSLREGQGGGLQGGGGGSRGSVACTCQCQWGSHRRAPMPAGCRQPRCAVPCHAAPRCAALCVMLRCAALCCAHLVDCIRHIDVDVSPPNLAHQVRPLQLHQHLRSGDGGRGRGRCGGQGAANSSLRVPQVLRPWCPPDPAAGSQRNSRAAPSHSRQGRPAPIQHLLPCPPLCNKTAAKSRLTFLAGLPSTRSTPSSRSSSSRSSRKWMPVASMSAGFG